MYFSPERALPLQGARGTTLAGAKDQTAGHRIPSGAWDYRGTGRFPGSVRFFEDTQEDSGVIELKKPPLRKPYRPLNLERKRKTGKEERLLGDGVLGKLSRLQEKGQMKLVLSQALGAGGGKRPVGIALPGEKVASGKPAHRLKEGYGQRRFVPLFL